MFPMHDMVAPDKTIFPAQFNLSLQLRALEGRFLVKSIDLSPIEDNNWVNFGCVTPGITRNLT